MALLMLHINRHVKRKAAATDAPAAASTTATDQSPA
jgi:hypothetical protein